MIADPNFKVWIKFPGMAAHTWTPSTRKAEAGRAQGQSWLQGKILSQNKKIKIKGQKDKLQLTRRVISCHLRQLV